MIMLATHLNYCDEDGEVTKKLLAFYKERAKYHPGLIIVGGCYTEHLGMSIPTMIGISNDKHIPGLKKLVEIIHAYNVPAATQLYHAGRYAYSLFLGEKAVSASAVPSRLTRETPRALNRDEIQQTVSNFGKAAKRAKMAGFDAVEIIGSAGYLINQFLARCTNKREDEYGGDLRKRAKFALEVIESVRRAVGKGIPIIYRMSGEDFVEDGNTLEENKVLAPWLVEAGIDCINVTGGWHETRVPQITMNVPRGHYAYLAEGIADVVDVPVIACNRINSPTIAEKILSRGKAELIGLSRGFIADPQFPEKVRRREFDTIRPCIGCNQGCLDHVFMLEPVNCVVNPIAGFETERKEISPGDGKIAVIGAGPSGMVVSSILANRGFNVTLYEEEATPGGLLKLAAKIPGRGEFASYISYLWRQLRRQKIDFKLDIKADVRILNEANYDGIICATGTIPSVPAIEGIDLPHIITYYDAIRMKPEKLGTIAVLGGTALGCYTASYLSSENDDVHIFEEDEAVGVDIGRSTRWVILQELKKKEVQFHTETKVHEILQKYLLISDNDGDSKFLADTVVVALTPEPRNRLATRLSAAGLRSKLVGSAKKPMNLYETVHDAFLFASSFQI
jgi:2,4-dienoyl-CoA reductase (NADPH2)